MSKLGASFQHQVSCKLSNQITSRSCVIHRQSKGLFVHLVLLFYFFSIVNSIWALKIAPWWGTLTYLLMEHGCCFQCLISSSTFQISFPGSFSSPPSQGKKTNTSHCLTGRWSQTLLFRPRWKLSEALRPKWAHFPVVLPLVLRT